MLRAMFAHLPLALLVMAAGWALAHWLGAPRRAAIWSGWFAGACACLIREVTQHEYRWIEEYGQGRRANMPVLQGLNVWEWTLHSAAETLVALGLSALLAIFADRLT